MRIGVLSDTHGHELFTTDAVRRFEQLKPQRLIHCGDIGSPNIARLLSSWHVDYVAGNVDTQVDALQATIEECHQSWHGSFADLVVAGTRIAVLHGDDLRQLDETIHSGRWQLVCHGHTHTRRWQRIGSTWVLNPGAVYRARCRSVALLELPDLTVQFLELTG